LEPPEQTSNPLWESKSKLDPDSDSSLNSFTKYYDFHFASLDCIAFADKCKALGIKAFPTLALYRNGEQFDVYKGKKTMEGLSEYVEQALERIKPGSRPRGKIAVPKPEAKEGQLVLLPGESAAEGSGSDKPAVPETPSVSKTKADDKPRAPANPHGTTVPLSAESFLRLVTATQDPWFIKFYAPWCSHCQALAPAWHQMAKEMKDKLNIGEVNCELEKRLCKDARVNSFPTIYFFRGGERVEYEGLRGLGDLMSFANKASDVVGNGVQYVDAAAFKELEEKEDVVFLYFFDPATTSEDFEALDRLTLSLVGRARLVKTNSTILAERYKITTFPRLLVSRDGRPSYYPPIAPRDMRDFRQVLSWMRTVWLPIVPELTIANAREIMEGKYVVLGILNRQRQSEFVQDKRELKNAALEWMDKQTKLFQLERQELRDAKQLRIEEAADRNDQRAYRAAKNTRITIQEGDKKQVVFAWVDGIFWDRWVRTTYGIDVRNGERVIINDEEVSGIIPFIFQSVGDRVGRGS
jgi:protein disulfide-isomerase